MNRFQAPPAVCPLNFDCDPCYSIFEKTGPRIRPEYSSKFGFDNFGVAIVSAFSATSLDDWASIAQPIRGGDSEMAFLAWPFFMVLVVVLNLVGVNLFLAGVTFSYMTVRKAHHAHNAMHHAYEMLVVTLFKASFNRQKPTHDENGFENGNTFDMDVEDMNHKPKSGAQKLMEWKVFDIVVTVTVIINICCLAVVHHGMNDSRVNLLEILDYIFTSIYVFEALVKIAAMGFKDYWRVKMNRLDFVICCAAVLGYAVQALQASGVQVDLVSLRIVRIMRIARAARALRVGKFVFKFERTKHMLAMAFGHVDAALSLLFLMCFWMVVFAVVAMYMFSTCSAEDRLARGGFKDFWTATMTNFQILSGDDWAWVMYEYMECPTVEASTVVLYFVAMHASSAFIMVNLFVAIFLENFQLSDDDKRQKQIDAYIQKNVMADDDHVIGLADIKAIGMLVDVMYSGSALLKRSNFTLPGAKEKKATDDLDVRPASLSAMADIEMSASTDMFESEDADATLNDVVPEREEYLCGMTDSGFRQGVRRLVEPKEGTNWYHRFIELCIVLSGMAIASEGPSGRGTLGCFGGFEDADNDGVVDAWVPEALEAADYFFYWIFLSECLFMIAAFGLYSNPHAYLRTHRAHWFDFFVVIVNTVDMLARLLYPDSDTSAMKVIRLLRVLRLLRLLEDMPAMALMAQAIEHSMMAVSGLIGLLMGSVAMFGIVGVSLFMGLFWHCSPVQYENDVAPSASFHSNATILSLGLEECKAQGYYWQNLFFNFDSLPDALSTLFICMTRQGWMELFWAAVDTTEHDMPPSTEYNYIFATVFFVLFVLINAFLLEQLFVGILVDVFSQSSGHALLTADQKNWQYVNMCVDHFANAAKKLPETPAAIKCQELMHAAKMQVCGHRFPVFKVVLNMVIVLNVTALILNSAMFPVEPNVYFDYFNNVCVVVYTIEVGIKCAGYGVSQYVSTEKMDFCVVVVMWPVAIHAYLQHEHPDDFAHNVATDWIQGLQVVRVFRTFDVINSSNRLRKLIQTIRLSIPHAKNLGMLMFLTYFVFSVCAMKLLGAIPYVDVDGNPLKAINEYTNFSGFWSSFMVLFQVTTGQPLPSLIIDCTLYSDDEALILPFFSIFYIISNFVFLNLFIALLLENFEYNWSVDFIVNEADVHDFKDRWHAATDARDESKPLALQHVRGFVEGLAGTFAVLTRADPFWFNRLLLELDLTPDDELYDQKRAAALAAAYAQAASASNSSGDTGSSFEQEDTRSDDVAPAADITVPAYPEDPRHQIVFHELLLALSRMRFGNRCLDFDREVDAEHKMQEKHEADAMRMISIFVSAWKMARNPPPHIVTDQDHKRWRAAVGVARLWVLKAAIKTIRVSNQRTWQHRQIDDVIGEAYEKKKFERARLRASRQESGAAGAATVRVPIVSLLGE